MYARSQKFLVIAALKKGRLSMRLFLRMVVLTLCGFLTVASARAAPMAPATPAAWTFYDLFPLVTVGNWSQHVPVTTEIARAVLAVSGFDLIDPCNRVLHVELRTDVPVRVPAKQAAYVEEALRVLAHLEAVGAVHVSTDFVFMKSTESLQVLHYAARNGPDSTGGSCGVPPP